MVIVLDGKLGVQRSSLVMRDEKGQKVRGKDTIEIEDMRQDDLF